MIGRCVRCGKSLTQGHRCIATIPPVDDDKGLPHEASCPKCGSKDKAQKYLKPGQHWDIFTATEETVFTICRNCKYSWEVKPLE
jgi:predicted nucleic-acid-binding Zn-ribbon protein